MKKIIAQQLNVTKFPFIVKDSNDNVIYLEHSDGYWWKKEFDSDNNEIYYENSDGFWSKSEYDYSGNQIYHEDSNCLIRDNRQAVELTLDEIANKFDIKDKEMKLTTPKEVLINVTGKEVNTIFYLIEEEFKKSIEIYSDDTPQKHVEFIFEGEYSIEARKEVCAKYVGMGWRNVTMRGSSENNERAGLTRVKLYFNS